MWSSVSVSTRWWRLVVVAAGILLMNSAAGSTWAQAPVTVPIVTQVEEDWELVIANPDSGNTAPQITCTISPYAHLNNLHSVVEINHKSVPSFAAGGFHLQTWVGEYNLTRKSIENGASLATTGEVITWTSRMKLSNNALNFSIVNGNSTTWGTFGGGTTLHSAYGSSLDTLTGYSPDFSVQNSGVGFANNRVRSLTLKRVRYTLLNGSVVTDDTPRIVHESAQQLEPE